MADESKALQRVQHAQGFAMPRPSPSGYESKYAEFIGLCAQAKADGLDHVLIAKPFVLGDTYAEIIESLSRLADAELALHIAGR